MGATPDAGSRRGRNHAGGMGTVKPEHRPSMANRMSPLVAKESPPRVMG